MPESQDNNPDFMDTQTGAMWAKYFYGITDAEITGEYRKELDFFINRINEFEQWENEHPETQYQYIGNDPNNILRIHVLREVLRARGLAIPGEQEMERTLVVPYISEIMKKTGSAELRLILQEAWKRSEGSLSKIPPLSSKDEKYIDSVLFEGLQWRIALGADRDPDSFRTAMRRLGAFHSSSFYMTKIRARRTAKTLQSLIAERAFEDTTKFLESIDKIPQEKLEHELNNFEERIRMYYLEIDKAAKNTSGTTIDVDRLNEGKGQLMPYNELGIKNGTVLEAMEDIPYFRLKKGDRFSIMYDGEYICSGGLSWDMDRLQEEIKGGAWKIVE